MDKCGHCGGKIEFNLYTVEKGKEVPLKDIGRCSGCGRISKRR